MVPISEVAISSGRLAVQPYYYLIYNTATMTDTPKTNEREELLQLAIDYATTSSCQSADLTKEKKRAVHNVRRKAGTLVVEKGEVFILWKKGQVKAVTSMEEQKWILSAYHSEPTSGHFGMTKTWRRVASTESGCRKTSNSW